MDKQLVRETKGEVGLVGPAKPLVKSEEYLGSELFILFNLSCASSFVTEGIGGEKKRRKSPSHELKGFHVGPAFLAFHRSKWVLSCFGCIKHILEGQKVV